MKLKNFYFFLLIFCVTLHSVHSQQKMTVKPNNFKPYTIEVKNNISNPCGYFIYNGRDYITTSFTNTRVFSSSINQSSVSAAILYSDPTKIFVGANTDNGMGYYYTVNSGTSWNGSDLISGSSYFSTNPYCIYGSGSRIYYNYYDDYIVTDRSDDYGNSWSGRITVPSSTSFDMNSITADVNSASSYYGRVYIAYSDFTLTQPAIFFSYSTNSGTSYVTSVQIGSPATSHYEQGANLQVGPNGELYCVWATPNLSTNIEDHIAFTKSTNGGASWTTPSNIITINGIRGTILPTNIRSHSFPSMAVDRSSSSYSGYIYLCWSQKNLSPAGSDADICFAYSANNGSSWSTPIRVNDDTINNGKIQFLPRIAVDQSNGKIAIIYYDNRDFINSDSCHTYMAISTNGGSSFTNIRISDSPQKPYPLSGYSDGYFSDYNSIVGMNDSFYAFWTDNRNGPAQAYCATVVLKPYIIHIPLKDSESLTGPYTVQATINTFGVSLVSGETKVFWGRGSITDSITMSNTSGNIWSASISGNSSSATYYYYIKTKDNSGRVSLLPDNAPTSTFSFKTGSDTTKPIFYYSAFPSVPQNQWPDTALVKVIDNIGIDSVWVVWYRNNISNGYNRFKLNSIGNDYYRGIFNSTPSQVEPADSIYYRIFAQDNSSNHNVDSTSLNKLTISQYYLVRIGSGTSVASYPFKTYYTDSRTDILYTASELIANGGSIARIMQIGFNISYASPQSMTNFNLKIQNTNLSSLTGFTSSGWTSVYPLTYTVPGTGWQYITFQTPFIWNGTSNLLIEICFDDASFNANSSVYATQINNMTWHQSQDLSSGSGCTDLTSGSTQTNRPNITFVMNSVLAVNGNENILPKEYSLSQNYPNPFNPFTKISYSIPKKDFVTLKIYDLLGREISTLVNEVKTPGNYIVDFDAKSLSSGVYFYKITTDIYSDTKKMILIK
jgi:hypothetical protein